MDGSHALDAGLVDALEGTNPQLDVRVHGVLHEDGHVDTLQGVGQRLHGEGISRRTGTHPEDVDVVLQRQFYVLGRGHLGRDEHLGLVLHLLQPHQGGFSVTFEAAGLRAGFPDAGTEVVAALHGQLSCGFHHLLLSLGRTGACNNEGAFVVTR